MPASTATIPFTDVLVKLKEQKSMLASRYNVSYLGVFGSYIRHQEHPGSDLDLLVEFSKTPSLLTFIDLENCLSDLLGVQVDLVMKDALKPIIGRHILQEVIEI